MFPDTFIHGRKKSYGYVVSRKTVQEMPDDAHDADGKKTDQTAPESSLAVHAYTPPVHAFLCTDGKK